MGRTETAFRITNIKRILLNAKLGPEITLSSQMESMRNPVVRLLQSAHLEPADIVYTLERTGGASTKRRSPHACVAEFLDDEGENVFDCAEGSVWELEGPLDLEAVYRRKLGKDDESADLFKDKDNQ